MKFGSDPNMNEETRHWIESTKPLVEASRRAQEANPNAGHFKGEKNLGGKFYPPGVTPPETVYDRMLREGKIKF
ncbi:MAG: hypothetical protein HQL63_04345 [Magnetococcales bacterium]|nr:hypothetical protein [Magnetococcales bacterium]